MAAKDITYKPLVLPASNKFLWRFPAVFAGRSTD
jgi:hypothetical protein